MNNFFEDQDDFEQLSFENCKDSMSYSEFLKIINKSNEILQS